MGTDLQDDTLIVSTSGRYEYRNKGLDVFIEAMNRLRSDKRLNRHVLAFIEVPGWVGEARQDLKERLLSGKKFNTPLPDPMLTHWLRDMNNDKVMGALKYFGMHNAQEDRVKVIFVPCYLTGNDGIIDLPYYDVVLGNDLCIYPSYYEPWGYTPLESIAFKVPCVTTDLSGFGLWVNEVKGGKSTIDDGVAVVHRTDYNYSEVADAIKDAVITYAAGDEASLKQARSNADRLSKKALWSAFIKYYKEAYDFALRKADARKKTMIIK